MSRVLIRNVFYIVKTNDYAKNIMLLNTVNVINNHGRFYSKNKNGLGNDISKYDSFLSLQTKTKESYLQMIEIFMARDKLRTGHVEFIYSALKHMKEFGVEKDLDVYKQLIDVFPKGKMIPTNIFQAEFQHYPKHQQCAIDLLEQMEENGVMPDWEMQDQLLNVFGSRGHPLRRYWRMMYWMPKFRNASPWPLPKQLPNDTLELAKMAIARITDIDPTTAVTVYNTKDIEASLEDTWIVSGQSEGQRDLICSIPLDQTLYVDGGLRVWLRDKAVTYFTLTTGPFRTFKENKDLDDISSLFENRMTLRRSIHESDESVVLGVASSGTSSADSMLSWVRALTTSSPRLANLKVLFRVSQPAKDTAPSLPPPQEKLDSFYNKDSF